jgi:hypothetical protein
MELEYDRDTDAFFERCVDQGTFPRNDALKLVVLERILEESFTVGETYEKSTVNERLEPYHEDYILLRRELVNFGYCRYDHLTNEYTVETAELSESDIRSISRLERHARSLDLLE